MKAEKKAGWQEGRKRQVGRQINERRLAKRLDNGKTEGEAGLQSGWKKAGYYPD
jgi:hypothetical protein